ncbi:MAG: 2-oxoglutarate dehydrogenase complex dihydrolipoyllysine-residue succinyltransferase [Desulfuromonadales bacterium]|nr:2-oxoglutarate dehydrogenase complex dihydrolipoyllysine-residue succinyltransferase [Desulfuromonadales bacterium]
MQIKIPEVGESIVEALVSVWLKPDGATVVKDDIVCELETDKVNVELIAEASGVLKVIVPAGQTVAIGTLIAEIDEGAVAEATITPATPAPTAPAVSVEKVPVAALAASAPSNPAARKLAAEQGVDLAQVAGSGRDGRVILENVAAHAESASSAATTPAAPVEAAPTALAEAGDPRPVTRQAMTPIRQRIAARLLEARQQTAMLTTFNEVDMTRVKALRSRHQEHFTQKHGIKLGLMSFFVKATVEALREVPAVNARIDGSDIVYHHYYDIGIAVGTDRGLVVPVLRNADQLSFAEIEQQIAELATKAQKRKLTLAELEGGTFTITNGGVYGSLLSTPIINPPQCGVLGMHSIQPRPVVRDDEVVIRPMMNLALSYDHRLIDGREAVGFLKLIKELIEDPQELMLEL